MLHRFLDIPSLLPSYPNQWGNHFLQGWASVLSVPAPRFSRCIPALTMNRAVWGQRQGWGKRPKPPESCKKSCFLYEGVWLSLDPKISSCIPKGAFALSHPQPVDVLLRLADYLCPAHASLYTSLGNWDPSSPGLSHCPLQRASAHGFSEGASLKAHVWVLGALPPLSCSGPCLYDRVSPLFPPHGKEEGERGSRLSSSYEFWNFFFLERLFLISEYFCAPGKAYSPRTR